MVKPTAFTIDKPGSFDLIFQTLKKQYQTDKFVLYLNYAIPFISCDIETYSKILKLKFDSIYLVFETNPDFQVLSLRIQSLFLSISWFLFENDSVDQTFFDNLLNLTGFSPILINTFKEEIHLIAQYLFIIYQAYISEKKINILDLDEKKQITSILQFFSSLMNCRTTPIKITHIEITPEEKEILQISLSKSGLPVISANPISLSFSHFYETKPFPTFYPLQILLFSEVAIVQFSDQFKLSFPNPYNPSYYDPLTGNDNLVDKNIIQPFCNILQLRNNNFNINIITN